MSATRFSPAPALAFQPALPAAVRTHAAVTCMFVSWRRERRITRAASLRTNSRRQDMVPDEESKWRQMYSARMAVSRGHEGRPGLPGCAASLSFCTAPSPGVRCPSQALLPARLQESIRRTEEATSRQQAQSRGPSFVEAQDQAFAAQAAASDRQLTPQMSSKYSCEWPWLPCCLVSFCPVLCVLRRSSTQLSAGWLPGAPLRGQQHIRGDVLQPQGCAVHCWHALDRFRPAAATPTPPLVLLLSAVGRGTPQTPATELSSAAKFERESPDHRWAARWGRNCILAGRPPCLLGAVAVTHLAQQPLFAMGFVLALSFVVDFGCFACVCVQSDDWQRDVVAGAHHGQLRQKEEPEKIVWRGWQVSSRARTAALGARSLSWRRGRCSKPPHPVMMQELRIRVSLSYSVHSGALSDCTPCFLPPLGASLLRP